MKTIQTNNKKGEAMKKVICSFFIALSVITFTSCGYGISITKPTTTTVVVTTTTINYGKDCNSTVETEITRLINARDEAWAKRSGNNGTVTSKEAAARSSAFRALRSYIRSLDIPILEIKQMAFVNALEDYLTAFNNYIESDKTDLAVNDYLIPLGDAEDDFLSAWNSVCSTRTKYTS
jgi:hypothetical protein